jgi:hypothetical protein
MDPQKFKTRMGDLAMGTALHAAAKDYQKELLEQEKAQGSGRAHEVVDLDDLMDVSAFCTSDLAKFTTHNVSKESKMCLLHFLLPINLHTYSYCLFCLVNPLSTFLCH